MPDTITTEFLALRDRYIASCFTKLNPVQQQAVFTTEGPLLILAGAGSGKTTVLVNRIANIIRFGRAYGSKEVSRPVAQSDLEQLRTAIMCGQPVPQSLMPLMSVAPARPWNVLAITFTNKAAGELKERLKAMLGDTMGGDVFASTFHSACVRILRRDAERIGFPKSFTIYDSDDQQRVIKQIYKELMIDDKFLPVKSAISQISGYKDKLLSAKDVAAEAPRDTKAALISKIYTAYSNRLRTAGAMDFDDLIFHTVQMLKTDAEAREYYQQKFRYVVVDEYQDTSVAQFHLVRLLAGGSNNVCVVGDDDQSIYKFRGATIENILNFEKVFAGAKTIRLEIADDFSNDAKTAYADVNEIPDGWEGLDIGPKTIALYAEVIKNSKTILWNGPTGVFEFENFTDGSRAVGEAIVEATKNGAFSLVGGGDSVACVNKFGLASGVSYVSTGGGALLEAIEGKVLPGIAAVKGEAYK